MTDLQTLLQESIAKGISYAEYQATGDALFAEKKTSPTDVEAAAPKMLEYTNLNFARMHRLDKTIKIGAELQATISQIQRPVVVLVISEVWCGDAAQNLPMLAKMADAAPNLELKIVWRDSNLPLIDAYPTRGGRSIPKVVLVDAQNHEELAVWGARPAAAQALVDAHKADPQESYEDFVKSLHLWYTKDKTVCQQSEFQAIFARLLAENKI
jgi:hypothetical protein